MVANSIRDRVKGVMDKKGITVAVLARETNIPAARIYKWYKDNLHPKGTDSMILEQWLNKIEEVPHETSNQVKEPQVSYGTTVENLTDSVKYLSQTEMINAENIRRLITLLELKMGVTDQVIDKPFENLRAKKANSGKQ